MSEMLETLEIFNARRGVASGILNTVWKNKFRSLKKYLNFKEIFYSIQKIYIYFVFILQCIQRWRKCSIEIEDGRGVP